MGATNSLPNGNSLSTGNSLVRSDTANVSDSSNRKCSRNLASTIKKRLSKKTKRFLNQLNYSKILREFLTSWSLDNLIQLVRDYETNSIIKDFYLQAELARPTISSVSQDLKRIYDTADCADVYLEFKDQKFPVHKSIVCARCPLFRELLGKIYTFGLVVPIEINIPEITTDLFSNLLRYLYSGEMKNYPFENICEMNNFKNLFENLSKHVPNNLEFDLKHLLNTGIYSDVKLVFKDSSSGRLANFKIKSSDNESKSTLNSTKNLTYNSTSSLNYSPSKSIKQSQNNSNSTINSKCFACSTQSEYSCHAAVLASRSRFFRNLILKYQANNCSKADNINLNTSKQSIRIVLDEEYIKKRYINVVLNVIYCDSTNILSLLSDCVCKCKTTNSFSNLTSNFINSDTSQENSNFNNSPVSSSSSSSLFNKPAIFQTISNTISSTEHTNSSIKPDNFIDEIIDLFVIGKFLELEILISICENLLVESINFDTVSRLLDWSEKSNGSEFVKRHCLYFLREEFCTISTNQSLFKLNESQFVELISSDFLQASEDEVLRAILRWTKFKLQRKIIGSNHLNNEKCQNQINELIGRLIKHLRMAHILPFENDSLKIALKNELSELTITLPSSVLNEDQTIGYQIMAWINLENRSNFVKPRFFQPFYDEARTLLDERLGRREEINFNEKVFIKKSSFSMPDNLYMVDEGFGNVLTETNLAEFNCYNGKKSNILNNFIDLDLNADRTMIKNLKNKILVNKLQVDFDYLDKETKNSMRQKSIEYYLKILPSLKNLNLEEKYQVLIYIQLKILREHNLPDEMLFIFEQNEPDYASTEKIYLDLKRKSYATDRKSSINSIDSENYLGYDTAVEKIHLRKQHSIDTLNQTDIVNLFDASDQFDKNDLQNFNLQVLNKQTNMQINHLHDQSIQSNQSDQFDYSQDTNIKSNHLIDPNDFRTFDGSEISFTEKEISLDVFI